MSSIRRLNERRRNFKKFASALGGRLAQLLVRRYLLPSACYFCGRPLTETRYLSGRPASLCASCRAQLPYVEPQNQGLLLPARPAEEAAKNLYSPALGATRLPLNYPDYFSCYSALRYEAPVNRAVAALKFSGDLKAVPVLGTLLAACLSDFVLPQEGHPAYIVPVPLHRLRLRERGFNQAAELAKEAGGICGLQTLETGLLRTRATERQSALKGSEQRAQNVASAFSVNPSYEGIFRGKFVLLVDDVLTTGATVRNAARVLVEAGAAKVVVVTLAAD